MSGWTGRTVAAALVGLTACSAPNPAYRRGVRDAVGGETLASDGSIRDGRADGLPADMATTPPGCPSSADLALCVRFEGAVVDESPHKLPISARQVGFASSEPGGTAGDVGATSLISIADNPALDLPSVSLEAWVNPRGSGRRMGIIDHDAQYGMFIQADGTVLCEGSNGSSWASGHPVTVGTWFSAVCTFDSTEAVLWIDGVRIASAARTGPLRTDSAADVTLASDGKDGNPLDGLIDNVRIWRGVRTAAEICAAARGCR
jgi:hypothetical protein